MSQPMEELGKVENHHLTGSYGCITDIMVRGTLISPTHNKWDFSPLAHAKVERELVAQSQGIHILFVGRPNERREEEEGLPQEKLILSFGRFHFIKFNLRSIKRELHFRIIVLFSGYMNKYGGLFLSNLTLQQDRKAAGLAASDQLTNVSVTLLEPAPVHVGCLPCSFKLPLERFTLILLILIVNSFIELPLSLLLEECESFRLSLLQQQRAVKDPVSHSILSNLIWHSCLEGSQLSNSASKPFNIYRPMNLVCILLGPLYYHKKGLQALSGLALAAQKKPFGHLMLLILQAHCIMVTEECSRHVLQEKTVFALPHKSCTEYLACLHTINESVNSSQTDCWRGYCLPTIYPQEISQWPINPEKGHCFVAGYVIGVIQIIHPYSLMVASVITVAEPSTQLEMVEDEVY
eukprot:Gb_21379 [translate_table: standard]